MNTQELAQERVDTSHFGWLRQLTKTERRTFIGCKVGYALDAMDTQFLSFVIPTLIATWGLSKGDAGLIGTVTLLTSSLGGWLGRNLFCLLPPDRIARRNLLAAFPGKSEAERNAIRRAMWDNLGRVVAEYPHLEKFSVHGDDPRIKSFAAKTAPVIEKHLKTIQGIQGAMPKSAQR